MIYRADLHTHSTASDGQYTPAGLASLVKAQRIGVWALTDHDSVSGVDEGRAVGERLGLRVVTGVELSADDCLNLHILGYGFSVPVLQGVKIPLDEVDEEAAGGSVGRPHFAMVMLKHGYVATRKEAFDRYLDTPEFQEIEKGTKPSAQECVERIKAAGGKVSLAHPYQIVLNGEETLEELVKRLKSYGLDAIECYYPIHTRAQTAEYLALAKKYGLHATGGSDFHGEKNKPQNPLAAWELELDWLL